MDGSVEFVVGSTRDISERMRAAEALRKNELEQRQLAVQLEVERSRLVTAQRVAKVGSWETDLATMAVIWSDETYRIFETDAATFHPTHQGFIEYIHPEDRARVDEAFAKSIGERGGYQTIEHRLVLQEGRIKFVEERWQILHDANDEPARAIGTCQDITERRLSAHAIEEALQRLTEAQSIGRIGDWEYVVATQAITWSAQVFEIVGRDPAIGPPKNYAENAAIFDAPSIALQDEKVAQALATGEAQDYDLVALHPNGERIHVHGRAVPRLGENGRIVSLRGTVQDITARKRSEALLMQYEVRIKRLNRVYAVMNGINAAIIRIRDRNELFQEACRIIVEQGHFILGWVAVLDPGTGRLTAVAQASLHAGSGSDSNLFDGSTPLVPGGTAEIALREKRAAVDNAIENDPVSGSGHEPDTMKVRRAAIKLGAR